MLNVVLICSFSREGVPGILVYLILSVSFLMLVNHFCPCSRIVNHFQRHIFFSNTAYYTLFTAFTRKLIYILFII